MPRTGPRRPIIAIRMTTEQIEAIDKIAETKEISRSDVIREAVVRYIKNHTR